MASSEQNEELGYDDKRFESDVDKELYCCICLLVLKDPVMCKNEHYCCKPCIEKYLKKSASCPTCREHLTVETLKEAPRIVKEYILKLNIHCDYYSRGCREIVQVRDLKRHVECCVFAPVQCSNEGCNAYVNKRDRLHHEALVCEFRKLKCHDCVEVKKLLHHMLERQDQMIYGISLELKHEVNCLMNATVGTKQETNFAIKSTKAEVKEDIKGIRNEIKVMKNEMKMEMKGVKTGSKEVKDKMNEMIDKMNNRMNEMNKTNEGIRGEMKKDLQSVVVEVNAIKDEVNAIKDEVNAIKDEMKREVNGMKSEMTREVNKTKEEMKKEVKDVIMETKAMKNEIKQETKGIKNVLKETRNDLNGIKEKIIVMKNDKKIHDEIKRIKEEIKVEVKEEINAMKAEMKSEIKETIVNAMQAIMAEMRNNGNEN